MCSCGICGHSCTPVYSYWSPVTCQHFCVPFVCRHVSFAPVVRPILLPCLVWRQSGGNFLTGKFRRECRRQKHWHISCMANFNLGRVTLFWQCCAFGAPGFRNSKGGSKLSLTKLSPSQLSPCKFHTPLLPRPAAISGSCTTIVSPIQEYVGMLLFYQ